MKRKNKKDVPKNRNDTKENTAVIKAVMDAPALESRVMVADPFVDYYSMDGANTVLQPPYNPNQLAHLREESDILGSCIDAYATNIVGFGYNVQSDIELDDEENPKVDDELRAYRNLFKYCNIDSSFTRIMKQVIADREMIGWGAFEVIPGGDGKPAGFTHIPAQELRLCAKQSKAIDVEWHIKDDDGAISTITLKKKFRKFVQIINGKLMYFKEFGDPRPMNCRTGEYMDDVTEEDEATAVVFFNIYCPYTPYGLPRYMGTLLNICGSREAQELNYNYFKSGRHIPMAIVVNNGHLTSDSENALKDTIGKKAEHKYLLLEAEPNEKAVQMLGEDDKDRVTVDIKPLATVMQQDGLFQEYCKNNRDVIRASFRLPPLYTGESQDYNRATADTAKAETEEQVFQPERNELEDEINNLFKNAMDVYDVSLHFNAPVINDDESKANALKAYHEMGGMTPNIARRQVSQIIGEEIEPIEQEWGDIPLNVFLSRKDVLNSKNENPFENSENTQENEENNQLQTENPFENVEQDIEKEAYTKRILFALEDLKSSCEALYEEDNS